MCRLHTAQITSSLIVSLFPHTTHCFGAMKLSRRTMYSIKILMEKYEQDMIKIRAEKIKASISKWETYAKIGIPILVSIGAFITIGWGIIKHKFKTT